MKEPFIYDEISTESSFDQFLLFCRNDPLEFSNMVHMAKKRPYETLRL